MTDIVEDLRSFDEGAPPADGWWVAWKDLQRAADEIERLRTIEHAAREMGPHRQSMYLKKVLADRDGGGQ